jgi:hypothetical protein
MLALRLPPASAWQLEAHAYAGAYLAFQVGAGSFSSRERGGEREKGRVEEERGKERERSKNRNRGEVVSAGARLWT